MIPTRHRTTHQRTARTLAAAAVALTLAVGVSACSSSSAAGPVATVSGTTVEAGAEIDPATFAATLSQPGVVVLDVRTPAEFAAGHLPGAVNIDVESAGFDAQVAALDKNATYAVYCRSGNRSAVALGKMSDAGIAKAVHLGGGINAWAAAGGQVVTG